MKYREIIVDKKINYYTEIEELYPIPTNSIIDKTLPGFGITYGELILSRHKICCLPNLPPIYGKGIKHPECFAVHGNVTEIEVSAYLCNDKYPIKKFICTPEAYSTKVRAAIDAHPDFNLYKDFFFLYDECDKLISDVDYRSAIKLPMNDFFQFDNKAMVSATPLIPSDPRFTENGFTFYKIIPDWDYKKDLKLIISNNVIASLKKYLGELNERSFIFFDSTDGIMSIIQNLNIYKESSIFCAEKSAKKLKLLKNFYKVFTNINYPKPFSELLNKYNFFTSRFFSAVDLDLPDDSNVIILTDLFFAEHSIIDPNTDSKQIQGRFRYDKIANKDLEVKRVGAKTLAHITNYNPDVVYKSEKDSITFLMGGIKHLRELREMKKDARNPGEIAAIDESMNVNKYDLFFEEDGKINYFMFDNYLNYEKLKGVYSSPEKIKECYQNTNFFNLIPQEIENYPISDAHKFNRTKPNSPRVLASLAEQLNNLINKRSMFDFTFMEKDKEVNLIKDLNPFLHEAFEVLSYPVLKRLEFDKVRIQKALIFKKWFLAKCKYFKLQQDVHKELSASQYDDKKISGLLDKIYIKHNIKVKAKVSHINNFFKVSKTTNVNNGKVSVLKEKIYKHDKIENVISKFYEVEVPKG